MPSLVWASVFLVLVLAVSVVACAGMIGMPIAAEVQAGLYAAGFLLAGFGWLLLSASPAQPPGNATVSPALQH